jgi:hypothetical protein
MKRNVCMFVFSFFNLILSAAWAFPEVQPTIPPPGDVVACFVDFRIGRVVGISEADISNKKYCKYAIDREKFLSLLTPIPASTPYMKGNVRALVSLSAEDKYFIDYSGVVRLGEKKFEINKSVFTNSLRLINGVRPNK